MFKNSNFLSSPNPGLILFYYVSIRNRHVALEKKAIQQPGEGFGKDPRLREEECIRQFR